ncbi:hypothetical protein [Chromobacterium vaccinii]|uniref:hypothetical protein n=1 Tax=Chromobacterium vaccinii TaxID=1108595 RepID=UPI003AF10792
MSTEAQNGASGKQLAREHAQSQLDSALSLSKRWPKPPPASWPTPWKPDPTKSARTTPRPARKPTATCSTTPTR